MSEGGGGALRQVAALFGVEFDDSQLKQGTRSIDAAVGTLRAFGAALAGAEIVRGLREFVTDFTEAGSAIQDASDRLGVSTRNLQELQYAAGQAGVRGEQLNAALTGLSTNLEQARAGGGRAGEAFHALGVRVTDANGHVRSASDVMSDVARGMDRVQDPARRVALASDIFGRAGRRLVGVLHEGSGGLSEMRQQFEELGGGMSDDAVKAADDFGDSLERLRLAQMGLKSTIGVFLLPALTQVTDWISHAVAGFRRLVDGTHVLEVAGKALGAGMVAAGTAALVAWAPVLLPIVAMAAAIAATILVVDDLWTAYQGGDSVLGRVEGVNTAMQTMHDVVNTAKLAWAELKLTMLEVLDTIDRVIDESPGLEAIARFFTGRTATGQAASNARSAQERREDIARLQSEVDSAGGPGFIARNPRAAPKARDAAFDTAHPTVPVQAVAVSHAAAGGRPAQNITHHTSVGPTTINVHGMTNAREAADYIERRLAERRRAENDAIHPRLPVDE